MILALALLTLTQGFPGCAWGESLGTDCGSPACRLQFPLGKKLAGIFEPTVEATIITPTAHVGAIMQLAQGRRGEMTEHALLGPERTLLK